MVGGRLKTAATTARSPPSRTPFPASSRMGGREANHPSSPTMRKGDVSFRLGAGKIAAPCPGVRHPRPRGPAVPEGLCALVAREFHSREARSMGPMFRGERALPLLRDQFLDL